MKSGTVTVLAGGHELSQMNDAEERRQISILKCPKFWGTTETNANSWTNSSKGEYNGDTCTKWTVKSVNLKIFVTTFVNIGLNVNCILL